ncbi:diacylglycerol/polyprenol kinase family protein [Calidithermus chliarophilus]|uniref:diacylglycerol/polyprenol kinase family protein n=1 Tax=Calidithermus chliarophilus TaxID=52023 RepID=UPI000414D3F5|nr:hypothetical protein [Calidithermus chliarophilus]
MTWTAFAVMLALGALLVGVKLWQRRVQPHAEVARKVMHIGVGVIALAFPRLFGWGNLEPVLWVCGVAVLTMVALRFLRSARAVLGSVLSSVERQGWGEVYFLLSIALLFAFAHNPVEYYLPLLVLTFADGLAALVGVAYGRVRYGTEGRYKSLEGSLMFFLVAFGLGYGYLLFEKGVLEASLYALLVASVSTLMEGVSVEGLDNLLVPVISLGVLQQQPGLGELALMALLAVVLAGLVAWTMTRSERNAPARVALILGALLGLVWLGWPGMLGLGALAGLWGWWYGWTFRWPAPMRKPGAKG